jgi:hypothetical protein
MEQTSGQQPLGATLSSGVETLPSPNPSADPVTLDVRAMAARLWRDAAAISLLALAAVIFFWPVISGQAWLPAGGGDSVSFLYPNYRFAADALWGGTLPFWNPYLYAGTPFLADNQSGLFYLPNLILFALWPRFSYDAIQWLVVWHFFFTGLAMYLTLRLIRPERPLWRAAALVGALAFMFSDVFITHIGNLNLIAVAAWLPPAFLGLHRAVGASTTPARLLWAVGGGVALGLGTLAGHGQMTFLLATFLGFYGLYETIFHRRWAAMPLLALVGGVAIGVAAVSLFPAAETLQHTLRAEFDYARSTNYALTWSALTGLVAPDFFGRGAATFWGDWLRVEAGYAGVVTWLLAAVAVALLPRRQTLFFVVAGLLFLLLALGPATPLYPWLARWLPIVPFQVPARFVLLLDFCLAMLAAFGLDALLRREWAPRRLGLVLGGLAASAGLVVLLLVWQRNSLIVAHPDRVDQMLRATLVFGGLALAGLAILLAAQQRWLPAGALVALILGLLFIDVYSLGRHVEIDWNDPMPGFAGGSPALAFLESDPGLHRLDITTGAWQPNLPQIEQLYGARGVYNPLQLANYNVYMGAVGYRGSESYNVLGVKYLIGGKKEPPGDTTFIVPVYDEDPQVTVYLNTRALPRAMVLYNADVVSDHDAAFDAVHSETFDPAQRLVLEGGASLNQPPGQSELEITRYDLNDVAFRVTTDRPAYFFLSDIYHPDWQATIDGRPVPIEIANYAFRAVYLDPGTHDIAMTFRPSGWIAGLVVTAITWAAILGLFIAQRRRIAHHLLRSPFWAGRTLQGELE